MKEKPNAVATAAEAMSVGTTSVASNMASAATGQSRVVAKTMQALGQAAREIGTVTETIIRIGQHQGQRQRRRAEGPCRPTSRVDREIQGVTGPPFKAADGHSRVLRCDL